MWIYTFLAGNTVANVDANGSGFIYPHFIHYAMGVNGRKHFVYEVVPGMGENIQNMVSLLFFMGAWMAKQSGHKRGSKYRLIPLV